MKLTRLSYYSCIALLCVFSSCSSDNVRTIPRMTPPYLYKDKGPAGTSICYQLLHTQFDADIQLASKAIRGELNPLTYSKGTSYVTVGKSFSLGQEELRHVLEYVERGNEFFLAVNSFDSTMMDTLGIRVNRHLLNLFGPNGISMRDTYSTLVDSLGTANRRYGFFYDPMISSLDSFDKSKTTVLGFNELGEPNFIVYRYGKGKFFFHTAPDAFTNYFLLSGSNTEYYTKVFSYLNHEASAVYWGDIYRFNDGSQQDFSALAIFWNNTFLMYALLGFCLLMLLYIAFGSKRRRRIVPQTVPNKNESLSFVHTIGNLYLQRKDNRGIAVKMINHFFEHLRTQHYIPTHTLNDEFIQALSRKTGVEEQRARELVELTEHVNATDQLSDQQLFHLNNLIYEFYKKK